MSGPPRRRTVVRPLTPDRWTDLERLFGPRGAYGGCWCTYFRQTGSEFGRGRADRGAGNRALLRSLAEDGAVPGLVAYRGEDPVGWVSVAPRPQFGRILRSPTLGPRGDDEPDDSDDTRVWSIVCFFIHRDTRGEGLGRVLLKAAVKHARTHGARYLEAYPVDTAGRRMDSSELYTGTLRLFKDAGFQEVQRRARHRPIVRLALGLGILGR